MGSGVGAREHMTYRCWVQLVERRGEGGRVAPQHRPQRRLDPVVLFAEVALRLFEVAPGGRAEHRDEAALDAAAGGAERLRVVVAATGVRQARPAEAAEAQVEGAPPSVAGVAALVGVVAAGPVEDAVHVCRQQHALEPERRLRGQAAG